MTKQVKIQLPKSVLDFPPEEREQVLEVIREAMKLPKTKKLPRATASEHNIWETNTDDLQAQAEDDLYLELIEPWADTLADLMSYLGLPYDIPKNDLQKAFTNDFYEWEAELEKAKRKGRQDIGKEKLSERVIRNMKQRKKFGKWLQDGKAFTEKQLQRIDEILREKLPDFAKKAEAYAVRAGFIGKIRNQAEQENFETLGAYIDRFPKYIKTATKEGVVLTVQEQAKAKAKGKRVTILPLTEQETEAVRHAKYSAGEKMTEISERHRAGVRQMVIQAKKERWSADKLARALYDKFGEHNRDWRRVAITELSFATNDAYLTNLNEGERVIGMGSVSACNHCKRLVIGKEFIVLKTPPSEETYSTDMKYVWAGKSNYGRRVAEWRACVPVHPNCRCRWHRLSRFYKVGTHGTLERKTTAELIQEERAKRGLPPDPNIEAKLKQIRNS